MATNRRMTYTIGINADTNELFRDLQRVEKLLRDISRGNMTFTSSTTLSEIEEAANAAGRLASELRNATNVNTGKLDLSLFARSLNASGMSLEDYRVKLSMIGKDGREAFMNVAKTIAQALLPIIKTNLMMDLLWITMKNTVRWLVTTSALRTFTGTIETAYRYAQDLNESLNSIRIVTLKSAEDMKDFAKQANEAAKSLSTTTTNYTDASLIYYQQGLNDEQVQGRTDTTIKLANVAQENAETASEQLTAIWNNFYDGSKSLEYYADVMVALGASTASSSDEIASGIQKFAAVSKTVGLSYEYAAAALATLTANTREAPEVIGNSLKTLFARLQGLSLGETLEDGVNLNKYSNALKSVGVDILDTNDLLKSMDVLLTETAGKWKGLLESQKTALAQTVAGVRQYNQFVALMDNWEDFEKNLQTAYGSSGALQEQANIFAESWEAARKRVKASAEDIYDSLINEDFFIGFDNGLSIVLDRIADVTDAMGGLEGILATVGAFVTKIYGNKIAQSIRDIAYNVNVLSGAERQRAIDLKKSIVPSLTGNATTISDADNILYNMTDLYRNLVEALIEANELTKDFSEYLKAQILNEERLLELITQRGIEYGEMAIKQRDAVNDLERILIRLGLRSFNAERFNNNIRTYGQSRFASRIDRRNFYNNTIGIAKQEIGIDKNTLLDSSHISKLVKRYRSLLEQLTLIRILTSEWNSANELAALGVQGADIKASNLSNLIAKLRELFEGINIDTRRADGSLATLEDKFDALLIVIENFYEMPIEDFINLVEQSITTQERLELALKRAGQAADSYKEKIYLVANLLHDLAATIVSIGNSIFLISMAFNAILNIGRVFSDEDLDSASRLTMALTSLSMLIPVVSNGIKLLNNQFNNHIAIQGDSVQIIGKGIAARAGLAAANKVLASSEGTVELAVLAAGKAINITSLKLIAITAGFVALAGVIYYVATAGRRAADAILETTDSYIESKEKLESLNNLLETANNRLDELLGKDSLTIIEQEELDKLKEEVKYLERQVELQEKLNKQQAIANANSIEENFETVYGSDNSLLAGPWLKKYHELPGIDPATGENNYVYETADDWFARVTEGLEEISETYKEYKDEYDLWIIDNEIATAKWADEHSSLLANIERDYENLIEGINAGYKLKDNNILSSMQGMLKTVRQYTYGKDYGKFYLNPVIDDTALSKVKNLLYTIKDYEGLEDEAILNKLGLSEKDIDEVINALLGLGVSLQEVINKSLGDIIKVKGSLKELFNTDSEYLINDFIGKQSADNLELLASLNFDNNINSLLDMYEAMARISIETKDWTSSLEDAKTAALDALLILNEGDTLDSEAIQNLQTLFDGIYNLSNLENLSTYELAFLIGEAFMSLLDVSPVILKLNKELSTNKTRLNEIDKELKDLGYSSEKTLDLMYNNWDEIEEKLIERGAIETLVDDAISLLDRLNNYRLDPIEIEIALIDSVLAQIKLVQKATSLIGEGFKVALEDVEELADTLPELLLNATVNYDEGILLLSQSVVDAIAESTDAAALAHLAGLQSLLDSRIDETNKEIMLIQNVRNASILGSIDAVAAISSNDEQMKLNKQAVTRDIIKAAILQAIEERTQSRGTADETSFYMNETTRIAGVESVNTAKNWARAFLDIAKNASKAFSDVANFLKDPSRALGGPSVIQSGLNARGMLQGTSKLGTYTGNAGQATEAEKLMLDWLDGKIDTADLVLTDEDGHVIDNRLDYQTLQQMVDAANKAVGHDIISVDEMLNDTWGQDIQNKLGADFNDWLEAVNSYLAKNLGVFYTEAAKIGLINGSKNILKESGLSKDKGGGSNKDNIGSLVDEEDKKDLEEIEDRYHEINREILRLNDLLDDIKNDIDRAYGIDKLKKYKKEQEALTKQLENQLKKLKEAQERYLPIDTAKWLEMFPTIDVKARIKDNGEIEGYEDFLEYTTNQYNEFINRYQTEYVDKMNALVNNKEALDAFKLENEDYWKKEKQAAEENYKNRTEALKLYEDTRDTIQDIKDEIEDIQRALADNRLSLIEYRLEIVLDVKSMKDAIREFDKKVKEIFNDALTHGLDVAEISKNLALAEADMYPHYAQQYRDLIAEYESADDKVDRDRIMKDIMELQGKVLDSANAIVDWVNSIEDIVPDAVDAAATRFKLFTDLLEHNTTVLDTIKELYALLGVTYKTMDGFNRLLKVGQEKLEAQVAEAKLQKAWYDLAAVKLLEALAALDSLGGDETDLRYDTYKKARDAYLQEFNEALEAYLSLAKDAMDTAQLMYLEKIDRAVYEFGLAVSGGIGLDLLQDKYDHYIEKDGRYFDKVNEAYQTTAWYNKLQADIDAATNSKTKERLKQLLQEIDIRREGNKLSQYDLDILNAKYDVLKAQMALEDAQNAKNNYQLVRDRQGNWNYLFTADPDEIANAELDLIEAQINWYNIAKEQVTDVTGEIISTWLECLDKIKEIYSDMTLTDQERSDRAAEIYAYYTDKIKYLEEEKLVAIKDMTEAGNASLFADAVIMGDKLTDLTGLTSEDIQKIAQEGGQNIIGLLTKDNETIKNIMAGNAELIDIFDNAYAKDLDNMTANTEKFEDELKKTLGEAEDDFRKYKDTVNDIANETGTTLDDLGSTTDLVSDSTDRLEEAGLRAADSLWLMIDAALNLAFSYADMANEIWGAVEALRALAEELANYVESKVDLDNKDNILDNGNKVFRPDYANDIARAFLESGGEITDYIRGLLQERAEKMAALGQGNNMSNATLEDIMRLASNGNAIAKDFMDLFASGSKFALKLVEEEWLRLKNSFVIQHGVRFDTGGYTGEFDDARLAFLHEKELVLNQEDTKNILDAVVIARDIGIGLFDRLEKILDGNISSMFGIMSQKADFVYSEPEFYPIELNVNIEKIEFPNATDRNEILEAFSTIANDAAQYVRRRKD